MDNDSLADRTLTPVPLELRDITKRFGTFTALETISFTVQSGKITALLGENGAGKTTLMRIAFGMIQPDSGSIMVHGKEKRFRSPADAITAGIGMVHQQFSLIPAMTVAENVALGGKGRFSFNEMALHLRDIADRTGLTIDPEAKVADLGSSERQKLEIIRAIARRADVMILDEPTAVLTPRDTTELFRQLRAFAASGGAVVLITHKLTDALEQADTVTVLRRGQLVLNSPISAVTESSLVAAMLGTAPEVDVTTASKSDSTQVVASLENAVIRDERTGLTTSVSFQVKSGEIVGVAALNSAATPLLRILAGRAEPVSGGLQLPRRIGFVPENRRDDALIEDFSLAENFALAGAGERRGVIQWSSIEAETRDVISRFDVRTASIESRPSALSGGNQQRFVLGRELRYEPRLLVLENPTQGLDVNATAFVHSRIRDARNSGAAVVFYSSDLDELAELSDRVVVLSGGLNDVPADRTAIGRALLGAEMANGR